MRWEQAYTRGWKARSVAQHVRTQKAATRIQAAWRRKVARSDYLRTRKAALTIQAAFRGKASRVAYRHLRSAPVPSLPSPAYPCNRPIHPVPCAVSECRLAFE